eukprot:scaffold1986_cov144-Skeletonema_menzelii.AAC.5
MAENVQNLQLTLQATGLKSIAGHGKKTSDPYAEVKLLFANEELFLGRTEVIKNSLSPKWTASFIFDHSVVGKDAFIEVSVVDKVGKGSDIFLGSAVFHIRDILRSRGRIKGKQLQLVKKKGKQFNLVKINGKKQGGMLYARICEVPPRSAGKLTLRWREFRGRSVPFFEIRRTYDDGDGESWTPVYRSERVKSSSPNGMMEWNPACIDVNRLCDGDLERKIQMSVFDYDKDGKYVTLDTENTTVNEIMIKSAKGDYKLMKGSKAPIALGECKITGADTPSTTQGPVEKLQLRLTLHATGLKTADKRASDPYAEVKLLSSGPHEGPEVLLGRTEVIKNSLSPEWATSFLIDSSFGKKACIKVSLVDKGSVAVIRIKDIPRSKGRIKWKRDGMLYARICEVPPRSAGKLTLRWQEFRGRSDPFFEVRRTYNDGDGELVYRSERVKKNWSPVWNPASIDLNAACDGDLNRKMKLSFFNHDEKGEHVAMVDIYTTINILIDGGKQKREYCLIKGSKDETISLGECKITGSDISSSSMKPPLAGSEDKDQKSKSQISGIDGNKDKFYNQRVDNGSSDDKVRYQTVDSNGGNDMNKSPMSGDNGSNDKSQTIDNNSDDKSQTIDSDGKTGTNLQMANSDGSDDKSQITDNHEHDSDVGGCLLIEEKAYVRKDLREGEVLKIPSGWLISADGVDFQVEQVSGESSFLTILTGPGAVWLSPSKSMSQVHTLNESDLHVDNDLVLAEF